MPTTEQLNYAIVAKPHESMYLMHKYWARKPHNVVAKYIENYSKEGEIVLDPFSGSGVTAIEAIRLNRKAVAIDLDPLSAFLIRETIIPIDLEKFKQTFQQIEQTTKGEIFSLYKTKCSKCKKETTISATIWNKEKPTEIRYSCTCEKGSLWKTPDSNDLELLEKIKRMKIKNWVPEEKLIWNSRINVKRDEKVIDLFTKRNLIALSILKNEIEQVKNKDLRELLLFTFSSTLPQASKLVFVIRERGKMRGKVEKSNPEVGSWATRGYWIPDEFFEINAWNCFDERFKKILRGKEESNKEIKKHKEADCFEDLKKDANIFIKNYNALELDKIIPANSIDYIFTDPPYGDAVPYLELNAMWNFWLGFNKMNWEDEIIISDSPERNKKSFEEYHKMLKAAFRAMYTVLKPNKYLTVTFHSTDIAVWNSIIKAVILSGFDLEKIIYQPPARPSAKGLLAPYGSAVGDYYIRFKKPQTEKFVSQKLTDLETYEREVIFAAKHIIEERGEPTIYQHILNGIMVELKGGRNAPINARKFEDVLLSHVGKEFELIPAKDEKGKVIGQKWWLKGRDFSNFSTPALSDRIERVILSVLDTKVKVSFDDILQEIFIMFPNALTPSTEDVKQIIEEYATKTPDGMWRLNPDLQEKQRISQHTTMIYYLAVLGKKAGYNIWIGTKEQGDHYNGKPLRDLCDNIKTFRFVPQETAAISRIKEIDLLWVEDGRIRYEFEVENTTGISEAIIRGSNIPDDLNPKRFIIIPEEREKKLYRKLQEPILQQAIQKTKWEFIRYKDLEHLFKSTKKEFDEKKLRQIAKAPRDKPEGNQTILLSF